MKEPKYSTEIILRYRQLMRDDHFDRKIVGAIPSDLMHDQLTLECGHTRRTFARYEHKDEECVYCDECAQAWLKENG